MRLRSIQAFQHLVVFRKSGCVVVASQGSFSLDVGWACMFLSWMIPPELGGEPLQLYFPVPMTYLTFEMK